MIVNSYTELCKMIGCVDDFDLAARAIYKGTNCGVSLQKIDNGVKIGSIVEGVDGDGTEYFDFVFPFNMNKFWETLTEVERQAAAIWNEAQAEMECSPDGEN